MKHHVTDNSLDAIPYGYCQCGCGQKTTISTYTSSRRQAKKGQPRRFMLGHRASQPLSEKLWKYVDKSDGPDSCWPWQISTAHGYGCIRYRQRTYLAHRVSYELTYGPIPDGLYICHKCNNCICVNPTHLYAGTQADNVRDTLRSGHWKPIPPHPGMTHYRAKLTDDEILQIRSMYNEKGISQRKLATHFQVKQHTIWSIVNYVTWKHLP